MLLRDRLLERMAGMGPEPDHRRLAEEVLGIRNAPPDLARRLVAQALVVEDRRLVWRRVGERICAAAPQGPGVYVLRDQAGRALYVGKAVNLRRRLRAHFAEHRWLGMKAPLARVAAAEWAEAGSELEALLREALLIQELEPIVNIQTAPPSARKRQVPAALERDVIVVLPSVDAESADLVAARADGDCRIHRTRRSGADLASLVPRLARFFRANRRRSPGNGLAPIVFSWLAQRGRTASRLHPQDVPETRLRGLLATLLADRELFTGRIVVRSVGR